MESNSTTIEKLIEKAEIYSKTTLELYKCEAIYKSADIFSCLAVKLAIAIVVVVVVLLFANIGLAFYLGDYFGEIWYGFFLVGFGYLFIGIILYIFKNKWIKNSVNNFIISKMNNNDLI